MSARLLAALLGLSALAAASACQSSGRYGAPKYAAASLGAGLAGAAISRATGGCLAMCLPGSHCNRATGLCERNGHPSAGTAGGGTSSRRHGGSETPAAGASYEPGHEYEVPPLPAGDAGCAPSAEAHEDGGVACEMDASVSSY
jgi:hypothetical protein